MIRGATNDAASNGSIQPPVIHLHLCVSEGRVYSHTLDQLTEAASNTCQARLDGAFRKTSTVNLNVSL